MRKLIAFAAVLVSTLVVAIAPAGAVTDGELDGNAHPYVGLVTFYDSEGVYLWRCSATLLSSTVLLTAGHCTEDPAVSAQVWFDPGPIEAGNYPLSPVADRPSCEGYTGWPCEGGAATGTPYTHPDYDPNAFYLHDLGVVVLDEPVEMDSYGALPYEGQLEDLAGDDPGTGDLTFTAVGYGLQKSFPDASSWKDEASRTRMLAYPELIQFYGDFALLLTNNANTGGTCFGDSGGPNFIGDTNVIGGVTSFGRNGTCAGTGGVYRIDTADDLEWLATFFPKPKK
jgi:Trypsin